MTNGHVILIVAVLYAVLLSPWWIGLIIGMVVGLLSCAIVDAIWWLMRKLTP